MIYILNTISIKDPIKKTNNSSSIVKLFKLIMYTYIIFLFCSCSKNISQEDRRVNPDGKVLQVKSNNDLHKEYHKSFYENGGIEYEVELLNGLPDGLSRYWNENGDLINVSNYENGKLHGTSIRFYSSGNIASKIDYFYGKNHGVIETYYHNGAVKSNQIFEFGEPVSELLRFDENGNRVYQP